MLSREAAGPKRASPFALADRVPSTLRLSVTAWNGCGCWYFTHLILIDKDAE